MIVASEAAFRLHRGSQADFQALSVTNCVGQYFQPVKTRQIRFAGASLHRSAGIQRLQPAKQNTEDAPGDAYSTAWALADEKNKSRHPRVMTALESLAKFGRPTLHCPLEGGRLRLWGRGPRPCGRVGYEFDIDLVASRFHLHLVLLRDQAGVGRHRRCLGMFPLLHRRGLHRRRGIRNAMLPDHSPIPFGGFVPSAKAAVGLNNANGWSRRSTAAPSPQFPCPAATTTRRSAQGPSGEDRQNEIGRQFRECPRPQCPPPPASRQRRRNLLGTFGHGVILGGIGLYAGSPRLAQRSCSGQAAASIMRQTRIPQRYWNVAMPQLARPTICRSLRLDRNLRATRHASSRCGVRPGTGRWDTSRESLSQALKHAFPLVR